MADVDGVVVLLPVLPVLDIVLVAVTGPGLGIVTEFVKVVVEGLPIVEEVVAAAVVAVLWPAELEGITPILDPELVLGPRPNAPPLPPPFVLLLDEGPATEIKGSVYGSGAVPARPLIPTPDIPLIREDAEGIGLSVGGNPTTPARGVTSGA